MDLNKLVEQSMSNLMESRKIEEMVQKQIEDTINNIISNMFRSWSDFGKDLEKKIESELKINLSELKLESYNDFVLACIKEHVDNAMNQDAKDLIQKRMDAILKNPKDEFKMTEMLDALRDDYGDEDDSMTLIIEEEDRYIHVYMDKEEDEGKWNCKYRLSFRKTDEFDKYTNPRLVPYSIKVEDESFDAKSIASGLYGLKDIFYQLYLTGSSVYFDEGFDEDDYDTRHGDPEERCDY